MASQDPPAHLLVTRPYTGPKNDQARLRRWYRQQDKKLRRAVAS